MKLSMNKYLSLLCIRLLLSSVTAQEILSETNLFAFVGDYVAVQEVPDEVLIDENGEERVPLKFDNEFIAHYRIVKPVYGDFTDSEITFTAFDHYGHPAFANYQKVLLFVSQYDGKLYHQKYLFYPVNQTADGRWAFCGRPDDYDREDVTEKPLSKILYYPEVAIDLSDYNKDFVAENFSDGIYQIHGNKAVCTKGVYVDELVRLTRQGVIASRESSENSD